MSRIALAFRFFFRILGNKEFADTAARLLDAKAAPTPALPAIAKPARNDALSLLAVLQREGRLIDFLKEDLTGYADAQIGAAARDVHRDCAAAIERIFAPKPTRAEPEGATLIIPPGFDAARIRLTGNVAGPGPYRGALRHAGWVATKVEIPAWTGHNDAARILAPAEVEIA